MTHLSYSTSREATLPDQIGPELAPLLSEAPDELLVEGSNLQPPECYWVTYRSGSERLVLKSFFDPSTFESYVAQLRRHYADRLTEPNHPLGGLHLIPALQAVAWRFPFDPSMPGLR